MTSQASVVAALYCIWSHGGSGPGLVPARESGHYRDRIAVLADHLPATLQQQRQFILARGGSSRQRAIQIFQLNHAVGLQLDGSFVFALIIFVFVFSYHQILVIASQMGFVTNLTDCLVTI